MKRYKQKQSDAETFNDTMLTIILKEIEHSVRLWPKAIIFMMLSLLLHYPKEELVQRYEQAWGGADFIFIAMLGFLSCAFEEFWRNRKSKDRRKFKYHFIGNLVGTAVCVTIFCCCMDLIGRFDDSSLLFLVPFCVIWFLLIVGTDGYRSKWEREHQSCFVSDKPAQIAVFKIRHKGIDYDCNYIRFENYPFITATFEIPDRGFVCRMGLPEAERRNIECLTSAGLDYDLALKIALTIEREMGEKNDEGS